MSPHPLFLATCQFVAGAAAPEDIPLSRVPEIAFVGRSNVGKSSLINALVRRKALARVSRTPGRTRQINFFLLAERLMLSDLPGYGYAKVSDQEKARWHRLITFYLEYRANLRRAYLLIDSRHGPKPQDIEVMTILDHAAISYQVVLTKIDKTAKEGVEKCKRQVERMVALHPALHPEVLATSATHTSGIESLQKSILEIIK